MESSMGARIAAWRRRRGMSQAELAAATGVSRSAVAQWETDRTGQVNANLSRISRALDVPVEVLLHGEGGSVTGDELALVRLYRQCDPAGRADVLRLARRLAGPADGPTREPEDPSGV